MNSLFSIFIIQNKTALQIYTITDEIKMEATRKALAGSR